MMAPGYFEIGHVGIAFDLDLFQHAIELARGRQCSSYPGKYAQVRIVKHVGAGKNRLARVLRSQGPNCPSVRISPGGFGFCSTAWNDMGRSSATEFSFNL